MTAERVVGGRIVILHLMMNGTDYRDLIHEPSELWQAFINFNVRTTGAPLPVGAPILARGIWFHVEHVNMTGASKLKEEDHVLRLGCYLSAFFPCTCLEDLRHGHSQQSHASCPE